MISGGFLSHPIYLAFSIAKIKHQNFMTIGSREKPNIMGSVDQVYQKPVFLGPI